MSDSKVKYRAPQQRPSITMPAAMSVNSTVSGFIGDYLEAAMRRRRPGQQQGCNVRPTRPGAPTDLQRLLTRRIQEPQRCSGGRWHNTAIQPTPEATEEQLEKSNAARARGIPEMATNEGRKRTGD